MKISDINKINSMIEHFTSLCRMVDFLNSKKEYLRLTVEIDDNSYRAEKAKIGIIKECSEAPEIYENFTPELLKLLEKRKTRLHKLLVKNGVDCEIRELENHD